jgi:aconitate hydratase
MAPEYGATCGIFPIDAEASELPAPVRPQRGADRAGRSLCQAQRACSVTGRAGSRSTPIRAATRHGRAWCRALAGPKRPQDRVLLTGVKATSRRTTRRWPKRGAAKPKSATPGTAHVSGENEYELTDGAVVICAITSCTNTSNPSVMLGAGLLARKVANGPEDQAVGQDLARAGIAGGHRLSRQGRRARRPGCARLQRGRLRLHHLHRQLRSAASDRVSEAIATAISWPLGAVGQPQLRGPRARRSAMNYLASPPLVVAYAWPAP